MEYVDPDAIRMVTRSSSHDTSTVLGGFVDPYENGTTNYGPQHDRRHPKEQAVTSSVCRS